MQETVSSKFHNCNFHGLSKHPVYKAWLSMKARCYNTNNAAYHNYGGRGISVCEEWVSNFKSFYNWSLSNGWSKILSIDRIDNEGIYKPPNCRWTTQLVQNRNLRRNIRFEAFGESKVLSEWAMDIRCVCAVSTLRLRLIEGWNTEDAITKKIDFKASRRFTTNGIYRKGLRIIEYRGQKKSATEWGEIFNIHQNIITWRIDDGWSLDEAMLTPKNGHTIPKDPNSGRFITKTKNKDVVAI